MNNNNYIKILILNIFISFVCELISSCTPIGHKQNLEKNVTKSIVSNVSRVAIPTSGGQTISLPRKIEDTQNSRSQTIGKYTNLTKDKIQFPNNAFAEDVNNHYLYRRTHDRKSLEIQILKRAEEYTPMILSELRKRNLPQELASLPLVESGFEANAFSPAGAAGLWQLMPETAKRFGLVVNDTIDERYNVKKATIAAISYLAELFILFNDWSLALASYNSGEGAMQKAIYKSNCSNLPDLITYTRNAPIKDRILKEETLEFVSKISVAIKILNKNNIFNISNKPLFGGFNEEIVVFNTTNQQQLRLVGKYDNNETSEITPPQSQRLSP